MLSPGQPSYLTRLQSVVRYLLGSPLQAP